MITPMRIAAVDVDLIPLPAVTPPICLAARPPRLGSGAHDGGAADHDGRRSRRRGLPRVERPDARRHRRSGPPRGTRRGARRPPRVVVAPVVGARPHRGVPDLAVRHRRRRALGPGGAGPRRTGPPAPRDLPGRDSRLRVDDDVRHDRGVPRRRRPVPRARLSRRSSSMPGETLAPTPSCASAVRAHVGAGHRPHVRRVGRLRPDRRRLSRSRARRGRLPLVRGADARVQRDRVQVARRARRGSAARRRDLRRQPPQHCGLHRVRLRVVSSARARTTAAGSLVRCESLTSPTPSGSVPRFTDRPSRRCISAWRFRTAPTTSRSSPRTRPRGSRASVRTVSSAPRRRRESRCRTSWWNDAHPTV